LFFRTQQICESAGASFSPPEIKSTIEFVLY